MTSKLVRHFWIVILVLVVACGEQVNSVTPTTVPISILTATSTPSPMPVSPTPLVTSTSTSLPVSFPPDGLLMAYIIDGSLYFQEGSNPAVQLTRSGQDWQPMFSDDGEKIVFFRGKDWEKEEMRSINRDGSQEQVLVTSQLLMALDNSYTELTRPHSLTFVPGTHLLLFATSEPVQIWNGDLLVVDTDSAEIKRLLPPRHIDEFYVSPDGKFIAVDAIGGIDVIDMGGKIVRRNLLMYTPSDPAFLPPGISWMPDSTGLIVLLPVPTYYEGNEPPDYTVWRYALDGSPGIQVSLDPLPGDHNMARVSLDGNWIIYNNYIQNAFYIGNLHTSYTELYESRHYVQHYDWSWSPDNEHFVYSMAPGSTLYLGSVNHPPEFIGKGDFLGWMDTNRYLYYAEKNIVMGQINGLKEIILADHEFFNSPAIFTFTLPQTQKR
jgi:hypothetical protein